MKTSKVIQSLAVSLSVLFTLNSCTDKRDIAEISQVDHIAVPAAPEEHTMGSGVFSAEPNGVRIEAIVVSKNPFVFQINRFDPVSKKIRSYKYQLPVPYFLKIGQISANNDGHVTLTGDIMRYDQVFSELFIIRFDDVGDVEFNLLTGLSGRQHNIGAYVDANNQVFIHAVGHYEPGYQSVFLACVDEEGGLKFATQYLKADQPAQKTSLVDDGLSVKVSSTFSNTVIKATIDKSTGNVTNFDQKYLLSGLLPEHGVRLKLNQRGIPVKKLSRFFDGMEADQHVPILAAN